MIIAVNYQFKQLEGTKPEKYQGFNGIRTRDLRDTGAMLGARTIVEFMNSVSPSRVGGNGLFCAQ